MASSLTAERVRRDIDVVAHAGLGLDDFFAESVTSISRAVPNDAVCIASLDPGSLILTGARKYGSLLGQDTRDPDWGLLEYGSVEESSFREMATAGIDAVGLSALTHGDPRRSTRMDELMIPTFSFHDEARVLLRDGRGVWGGISLFRSGSGCRPFDDDEIGFLASLSRTMAHGVRAGLLSAVVAEPQTTITLSLIHISEPTRPY